MARHCCTDARHACIVRGKLLQSSNILLPTLKAWLPALGRIVRSNKAGSAIERAFGQPGCRDGLVSGYLPWTPLIDVAP